MKDDYSLTETRIEREKNQWRDNALNASSKHFQQRNNERLLTKDKRSYSKRDIALETKIQILLQICFGLKYLHHNVEKVL